MAQLLFYPRTVDPNDVLSERIQIPEGYQVIKAFIWDNGYIPICESAELVR